MTEEWHGISWCEYGASTEADALAFIAEAKSKGYDVDEPPFHAMAGTDGRFAADSTEQYWSISVYVDYECVSEEILAALGKIAEKYNVDDMGSEPSTSFDNHERDASVSAHL